MRSPSIYPRCIESIHVHTLWQVMLYGHSSPCEVVEPTAAGPLVGERTYSGPRATSATGGGLRPSATVAACRGVLGQDGCHRGVRRGPVPPAGRQVPRPWQRRRLSDLPERAAHARFLGVRGEARPALRLGAYSRRTGSIGRHAGRILGARGRGLPFVQLEPPRSVLRPRRRSRAEATASVAIEFTPTEPSNSE